MKYLPLLLLTTVAALAKGIPGMALDQDGAQLGLSKQQVVERSGVVPNQRTPEIVLYTKDYQIIVNFRTEPNGLMGPVNFVFYRKIADLDRATRLMYEDPSVSQKDLFTTLSDGDVQKVLDHYTEENKFTWKKVGADHWRRTDDAEACVSHGMFVVATKEAL
jgi:hypothetical protein